MGMAGKPGARPVTAPSSAPGHATAFVWCVWALLLLAALGCVAAYAHNVPLWDDFILLPYLTGERSLTVSWLWEPHNEHRIPLPKLILLTLLYLSRGDFRAGMYASVALMGGLAALFIRTARSLRGWTSYADAFFPLSLLHGGHYDNFLWGFEVQFTASTALAGILLALIVRNPRGSGPGTATLAGICLLMLPLCGANGLAYTLPAGLWLGAWSLSEWCAACRKRQGAGIALLALAVTTLLWVPLYFQGLEKPTAMPPNPGLWNSLRTGIQFGCMVFGYAALKYWRWLGWPAVAIVLLSLAVLVAAWRRTPERLRASGLLVILAGVAGTAVGVAWGRSGFDYGAGLQMRYVTLVALAPCCLYYIWEVCGPTALAPWARAGFFALATAIVLFNIRGALKAAKTKGDALQTLEEDVRAGVPVYRLARRYTPLVQHSPDVVALGLRAFHQAGIGVFKDLREDPPFREIPLPVEPVAVEQLTWSDGTARGSGPDSYLLFALPEPRYVAGIRIAYTHANQSGSSPVFRACWKGKGQTDFSPGQSFSSRYLDTGQAAVTLYIGEVVEQLRLYPDDRPFQFYIESMVLLVPEGTEAEVQGDGQCPPPAPGEGARTADRLPGRQ